jgi:predicted RNA methylase
VRTNERLHTVGAALRDKAIAALNAPRVTNTARRANMADGAIARAERERGIGEACVRIAAIGDGPLTAVRCLAHVRFLESMIARSRSASANKLGKRFEDVTDEEGAERAHVPLFRIATECLRTAARDAERAGAVNNGMAVDAIMSSGANRHEAKKLEWVDLGAHQNSAVLRFLREGKKEAWVPWQFHDVVAEQKHLEQLGVKTDAELRALLVAYVAAKQGGPAPDRQALRIRQLERQLVGAKIPGYFPTPPEAADRVVELARIEPGMRVLEPSAGKGDLAEAIRRGGGGFAECVERQATLHAILMERGYVSHHGDFLELTLEHWRFGYQDPAFGFDRVCMNPPFEDGADMTHVQHAFGMLRPGGRLVAIMSEGTFFREDRQTVAFRAWLDELGAENEKLAAGTFNRSDVTQRTNVATRIVVIDTPRS